MVRFQIIVHEGVVASSLQPRLAEEIRRIYSRDFGAEVGEIRVHVTEIPRGRFFTAGETSTSSLVGGTVPAGTTSAKRTALMSDITSMWCELTGRTTDEIVVSISDPPS